jgi:hypothetical protein
MYEETDVVPDSVTIDEIELEAKDLNIEKAASIYREHGCLVVRGLMKPYVEDVLRDINFFMDETLGMLDRAELTPDGWYTPNGALLLPAPEGYVRDQQVMIPPARYHTSAALFRSAWDDSVLDLAEAILGPNIELFLNGQCLVKEPVGGHPKLLHQDAAYFEHKYEGPMGMLVYAVDTSVQNGALYVVPGSHRLGVLKHGDTFSHLGLDEKEWTWDRALPVEGKAGDAIFFHVNCIHGSPPNHTDQRRPVFIHRYRRADDYIVIGAATAEARAEAEKQVEQARKENQLGMMVRGTRAFDEGRNQDPA